MLHCPVGNEGVVPIDEMNGILVKLIDRAYRHIRSYYREILIPTYEVVTVNNGCRRRGDNGTAVLYGKRSQYLVVKIQEVNIVFNNVKLCIGLQAVNGYMLYIGIPTDEGIAGFGNCRYYVGSTSVVSLRSSHQLCSVVEIYGQTVDGKERMYIKVFSDVIERMIPTCESESCFCGSDDAEWVDATAVVNSLEVDLIAVEIVETNHHLIDIAQSGNRHVGSHVGHKRVVVPTLKAAACGRRHRRSGSTLTMLYADFLDEGAVAVEESHGVMLDIEVSHILSIGIAYYYGMRVLVSVVRPVVELIAFLSRCHKLLYLAAVVCSYSNIVNCNDSRTFAVVLRAYGDVCTGSLCGSLNLGIGNNLCGQSDPCIECQALAKYRRKGCLCLCQLLRGERRAMLYSGLEELLAIIGEADNIGLNLEMSSICSILCQYYAERIVSQFAVFGIGPAVELIAGSRSSEQTEHCAAVIGAALYIITTDDGSAVKVVVGQHFYIIGGSLDKSLYFGVSRDS